MSEERQPDYYKFHRDMYEFAKELPNAQAAKFSWACISYFYEGKVPNNLPERVKVALSGWYGRIDKSRASSYRAIGREEKKREESDDSKGKSRRSRDESSEKTSENPSENFAPDPCLPAAMHISTAQEAPIDKRREIRDRKERDKDCGRALARPKATTEFVVPSYEDAEAFFAANGTTNGSDTLADRFVEYYEERGWKSADGRPVNDWKTLARAWIGRAEGNQC